MHLEQGSVLMPVLFLTSGITKTLKRPKHTIMKILRILFLVTFSLLLVNNVAAQSAKSGIKGGVNFSNLFVDNVDDENLRTGFHAGFYTQFLAPSGWIGFQPEILV